MLSKPKRERKEGETADCSLDFAASREALLCAFRGQRSVMCAVDNRLVLADTTLKMDGWLERRWMIEERERKKEKESRYACVGATREESKKKREIFESTGHSVAWRDFYKRCPDKHG